VEILKPLGFKEWERSPDQREWVGPTTFG